ncbi:RICIN domain-containing protein [Kitasatospora sp. NPDC058032]|uniref:RICIN domain-containing protein n=1 Tax=Kitasatospora sp. NPDC058032 TaxID=3346307 RepID=UPI0036D89EA2
MSAAAAVLTAAGAFVLAAPTGAHAESGLHLDLFEGSTADGTPVGQWRMNADPNQRWYF